MTPISFPQMDTVTAAVSAAMNTSGYSPTVEDCSRMVEAWQRAAYKNPLLRQYLAHLGGPMPRNTLPWHALGERLYWQFVGSAPQTMWTPSPQGVEGGWYLGAMEWAQVYLWRSSVTEICDEMPDLPRHVISRKCMPFPIVFFSRETSCPLMTKDGVQIGSTNGMLLAHNEWGIGVAVDSTDPEGTSVMCRSEVRYGNVYPDDFNEETRKPALQILKMLAFLSSHIPRVESVKMGRPERRRMSKAGYAARTVEETVSVVDLRAYEGTGAGPNGTGKQVDRSHHWWVRGHWRAQWFASEKAHHPIWIESHIKGDQTKPLLDKVYNVNR